MLNGMAARAHGWNVALVGLAVLTIAALLSGLGLFSLRALAVVNTVTTVQEPGYLHLTSDLAVDEVLDISPGEPAYWQITANLTQVRSASLVLEIRKDGDLAAHRHGLVMAVERCNAPWQNLNTTPRCDNERVQVLVATPRNDNCQHSAIYDLGGISSARGKYLLVELSLNMRGTTDKSVMGLTGTVGVGLTAAGDKTAQPATGDAASDIASPLSLTGIDVLALVLIGLGALGLGAVISAARRFGPTPPLEQDES